jgi:putative heme iron utilization protein
MSELSSLEGHARSLHADISSKESVLAAAHGRNDELAAGRIEAEIDGARKRLAEVESDIRNHTS